MVQANAKKKFLAKVVLLGDINVGKTSLINKFVSGNAGSTQATVGNDFKSKTITINDSNVTLQMWDTAGQERFASLTRQYVQAAAGVILGYDTTDANSI